MLTTRLINNPTMWFWRKRRYRKLPLILFGRYNCNSIRQVYGVLPKGVELPITLTPPPSCSHNPRSSKACPYMDHIVCDILRFLKNNQSCTDLLFYIDEGESVTHGKYTSRLRLFGPEYEQAAADSELSIFLETTSYCRPH